MSAPKRVFFGEIDAKAVASGPAVADMDEDEDDTGTLDAAQSAVEAGIAAGHINISSESAEVMDLSEESQAAKRRQEELLRQMEQKKKARAVVVPTNDKLVKQRLRELGEPICYFGEKAPERRERLRELLARKAVEGDVIPASGAGAVELSAAEPERVEKEYYSEGLPELRAARLAMTEFSLGRARQRLEASKARVADKDEGRDEANYTETMSRLSKFQNQISEIGDDRPLAACSFAPNSKRFATGSWGGQIRVWDLPSCKHIYTLSGHKNRVSDVAFHPLSGISQSPTAVNVASCGIDNFALLYALPEPGASSSATSNGSTKVEGDSGPTDMDEDASASKPAAPGAVSSDLLGKGVSRVTPIATLEGHTDRLCRLAFHPSGRFLVTSSADHTWRLWDIETSKCLVAQGGHSRGVYAIAAHPDGSLVATGDLGGIALLWDLRTGKIITPLLGHVKQVLCADFASNGYECATGSDDHTVKIFDLRRRKAAYTIPAHSALVSTVRYQPGSSEFLLTAAYDNTCKLWSARDYSPVKTLAGHESKVMRADISPDSRVIASVAMDRTFKLWTHEDI